MGHRGCCRGLWRARSGCGEGLLRVFALVAFALVPGLADGIGRRETKADRSMARLILLLSPWETCSLRIDESDLLVCRCQAGVGGHLGSGAWSSLLRGSARKVAAAGTLIPSMGVSTW